MDPNVDRNTQMTEDDEPLLTQPTEDWRREKTAAVAVADRTTGTAADESNAASQPQNEDGSSPDISEKNQISCAGSNQSFLIFQTAGKNATIHVSKASLSRAKNDLFSNTEVETADRSEETPSHYSDRQSDSLKDDEASSLRRSASLVPLPNEDKCSIPPCDQNTSNVHNDETSSALIDKDNQCNSSEPDNSLQSIPMLQTAGKKETIHVSKESLSKANNLFSGIEVEAPDTQPQTQINSPNNSPNKACDEYSPIDHPDARENSVEHHSTIKPPASFPMFQTAGKKQTIHVSDESMSKVNDLFLGTETEHLQTQPELNSNQLDGASIEACDMDSSNNQQDLDSSSSSKPTQSVPVFQTAGKKQTIHVSKERLSEVDSLFLRTEVESLESNQHSTTSGRECGVNAFDNKHGESLNPHLTDAKALVSGNLNIAQNSFPIFQTAGKKHTIQVSKESLSKANKFFVRVDIDSPGATSHMEHDSTQVLDSSKPVDSVPMFQTAGEKQSIHNSKESLVKANDLSSDMDADYSDTRPEASSNDLDQTHVASKLVQRSERAELIDHPPNAMFQTAGTRAAIGVSAESLRKVDGLFACMEADAANSHQGTSCDNLGVCEQNNSFSVPPSAPIPESLEKMHFVETVAQANVKITHGQVKNPYMKQKSAPYTLPKRTIQQVSQPSLSNCKSTSTSKQVHNPYVKQKANLSPVRNANQVTRNNVHQSNVDNPYATKKPVPMNPSTAPSTTEMPAEAMVEAKEAKENASSVYTSNSNNLSATTQAQAMETSVSVNTTNPHLVAPSNFFSMADRLPSRNVSYQPAEILTVGELYRYLYQSSCDHDNTKENNQENQELGEKVPSAPTYRQLTSVRVTGVLLVNSFSDSHEDKTDLYAGGAWLLVGDPLEKTRHATPKPNAKPNFVEGQHTPSIRKGSSTSVECNTDQATASVAATPKSVATSAKNVSSGIKNNTLHTSGRSGGLINDKKRKLVCNKYSGRNSLTSSKGMLNARKFQTPKRSDLTSSLPMNGMDAKRGALFSPAKRAVLHMPCGNMTPAYGRNLGACSIIQRHPSPVVPVWNGSRSDTNGLEGSVTGDLVMVMGEIIVELCDSCRDLEQRCGKEEEEPERDSTTVPEYSDHAPVHNVRDAARLLSSLASKGGGVSSAKCCSKCVRFLRARFVKNANGTDMNLQKEALRVRREYLRKRQKDMSLLFSGSLGHFTIGSGPFA